MSSVIWQKWWRKFHSSSWTGTVIPRALPRFPRLRKSQHETRAFFRKVRRTGQQIGKSNMVAEDLKSFGKKNQLASIQDRKERAPWHLLLLKYYRRHLVVNRPKIDGKSGRKRKKSWPRVTKRYVRKYFKTCFLPFDLCWIIPVFFDGILLETFNV